MRATAISIAYKQSDEKPIINAIYVSETAFERYLSYGRDLAQYLFLNLMQRIRSVSNIETSSKIACDISIERTKISYFFESEVVLRTLKIWSDQIASSFSYNSNIEYAKTCCKTINQHIAINAYNIYDKGEYATETRSVGYMSATAVP